MRARYDSGRGGLAIEDFLLLREGNALYTSREHKKLYQQWRVRRFSASEIPVLMGAQSPTVSFRTELQTQSYPIFGAALLDFINLSGIGGFRVS